MVLIWLVSDDNQQFWPKGDYLIIKMTDWLLSHISTVVPLSLQQICLAVFIHIVVPLSLCEGLLPIWAANWSPMGEKHWHCKLQMKKIAWWHLELTHLHPIECGLICCSEHKNYHRSVILSGHSQSMLPHLGAASVYLCSEIQNWELQKYIESNAKTVEEAFIPVLLFVIPPNAVRSALWVAMSFLCF